MQKIKILTDSTCDIPKEEEKRKTGDKNYVFSGHSGWRIL